MIDQYKHFTQKFGQASDRVRKTGNIVYCHLPYLPDTLALFRDWEGEELTFVCEGGDVCLHLSQDEKAFLTGNTTQAFKSYLFSEINPKIKKIYSTNLNFHHQLFSVLPEGVASKTSDVQFIKDENNPKKNLLLANFSHHTRGGAGRERSEILDFVKNNAWITFQNQGGGDGNIANLPVLDLLREISASKFVFCPISNGFDTSRISECLNLGSIPVVKRYPIFNLLNQEGFPFVMVDKWGDLNKDYLNSFSEILVKEAFNEIQYKLTDEYWIKKIESCQ